MPIVMDGYVVVPADRILEHEGHVIAIRRASAIDGGGAVIDCVSCHDTRDPLEIAREYRSTSLPCGCGTREEHDSGATMQRSMRKQYRITRSACVGCYLGDDGPSMHDCYVHSVAAGNACEGYNIAGRWVDCDRTDPHGHGILADMEDAR